MSTVELTARERDVLLLLAEGLSNKAIAKQLGLSPDTIKDHLRRLSIKLAAHDRHHIVLRVRELGLLDASARAGGRVKSAEKCFGVAVFGGDEKDLKCYCVLENATLHGAVRSKERTWREDPMRRVVQKQPDGKWYVMTDIHRLFHPKTQ